MADRSAASEQTQAWPGRTRRIRRPPIAGINALARELRAEGRRLIDLGQAILGVPPPPAAMAAVRRYLEAAGPQGYSPDPGLPSVLDRVARFLREQKGIAAAAADRLILTCGANQAFVNALMALTEPGDEVILFGPYYFDHLFAIELGSCVPVEVALRPRRGRFVLDLAALEAALSERTRAVVLVAPANPAGMVLSPDEVAELTALCRRRGIWLVSDETYDLLTFPPAVHRSPAALDPCDRVVVVGSFSKTFALAGWRIGYLYGPPQLVEEAIKVQDTIVVCAPVPAQRAVEAALDEADAFAAQALGELARRRDALLEALEPVEALTAVVPDGATFVLAAIESGASSVDLATTALRDAGVITVPGAAFGPHGEGYLRLSFGNQPPAALREAATRLGALR
ncbi:MAG: pyridoxal phosphate-dependent aminotransferase [Deltaproteobacteria bacterium]|nr:pyridoxal phosphate-dependent aminotransferase [Deltaproteobacteria bacterium]MBW2537924.1 pyridoxal phosphate-dependent aminotransferase [Deltaproteobacteria bacterium]